MNLNEPLHCFEGKSGSYDPAAMDAREIIFSKVSNKDFLRASYM